MINAENVLESTVLRCVRTSTSMQSGLDRVHTILSRTTETNRVRNALRGYWLSRLHTQALIDRDREQTPKSKMIAHSRKAVDEDGRLCFVFFFYTSLLPIKTDYLIITNKNRSFIHYFFARNNIQLHLHICCTPDLQQSLRLFIGPVATSHLRERFVPGV